MDSIALLIAPTIGSLATLIGILITYRRNRALFQEQHSLTESTDHLRRQLAEFYGPIHILLDRAQSAFDLFVSSIGTVDEGDAKQIVSRMLIPTNDQILSILLERVSLLHRQDDLRHYLQFIHHADSLRLRFSGPASMVPRIPFPRVFPAHVRRMYALVRADYEQAIGGTNAADRGDRATPRNLG